MTWGPKVAAAYVKAFAELSAVTKGRTANVGSYSYTFADLEDTLSFVRPILAKHGLALSQDVRLGDRTLDVLTTLVHESGESVTSGPLGFPAGGTPQQGGSAITYARRYALLAALGVATEDDDGQKAAQPPPERFVHAPVTDGERLYARLAGLSDEKKAELKALATDNNRKLTVNAFNDDARWFELVEATLTGGTQ